MLCPHGTAVSSEQECRKAATSIQKQFDQAWNGPNDFPGCLIANDGRDKVYWNTSPSPSETANNPQYGAICIKNAQPGDCNTNNSSTCLFPKIMANTNTKNLQKKFIQICGADCP